MQTLQQVARIVVLHKKWIGDGPVDAPRIAAAIKRERAAVASGAVKVTRGLLREMRAEAAEVGRYINAA